MNCNSSFTPSAPPCAGPMSSVELRWWGIASVVVIVLIFSANWIAHAPSRIPPFPAL